MKLEIDLIPSNSWFKSLYRYFNDNGRSNEWKQIKVNLFQKEGEWCWICGSIKKPLEAHESWQYDKKTKIRKLTEIHHLCGMCHKIKHYGLWTRTDYGEEQLKKLGLSKKDLINHFCNVNKCTQKEFEKHKTEAFDIYNKRNMIDWKLDLSLINKK
jgi:hypothetical protein